jgi:hypothetical protein
MSRPFFSGLQTQPRPLRLAGAFSIAKGSATSRLGMARARKVIAARVIPWENQYGIAVVFERGNHVAYPVGDREEAERQVQLVLNHPDAGAVLRKATD